MRLLSSLLSLFGILCALFLVVVVIGSFRDSYDYDPSKTLIYSEISPDGSFEFKIYEWKTKHRKNAEHLGDIDLTVLKSDRNHNVSEDFELSNFVVEVQGRNYFFRRTQNLAYVYEVATGACPLGIHGKWVGSEVHLVYMKSANEYDGADTIEKSVGGRSIKVLTREIETLKNCNLVDQNFL